MSHLKYSQEILDKMIAKRNRLMGQLNKFKIVSDGEKSEFWKEVKGMILPKLEAIEKTLDEHEKLTDTQKTAFLEARKQLKYFARIPQDFAGGLPYLNRQIAEMNEKINDYKRKLKNS